eukprot:CAMPEP_0182589424 /NCGR_PEP_ID=MMETSP1324-20130603/69517_1 /TAXON_ID=236786 /ORGANISM="Florenciella sp., Strain RCC1587" /LENGTH=197 /DNA_ID=CAMNT_0024806561 /DNA_START=117 /DNA_END=711 /DNA_ORIENTATION=+
MAVLMAIDGRVSKVVTDIAPAVSAAACGTDSEHGSAELVLADHALTGGARARARIGRGVEIARIEPRGRAARQHQPALFGVRVDDVHVRWEHFAASLALDTLTIARGAVPLPAVGAALSRSPLSLSAPSASVVLPLLVRMVDSRSADTLDISSGSGNKRLGSRVRYVAVSTDDVAVAVGINGPKRSTVSSRFAPESI